jgi:hypothetical protein
VGSENLNVLLVDELAALSAASVDNMARGVGLLFRVMKLESKSSAF